MVIVINNKINCTFQPFRFNYLLKKLNEHNNVFKYVLDYYTYIQIKIRVNIKF